MNDYTCIALFNKTSRFSPYTPGDDLKPSMLGAMPITANDPQNAAEKVFYALNADDRPNGRVEVSLSVGDVVEVRRTRGFGLLTQTTRFACENVGWKKL